MQEIIRILNQKGYITEYCCESHNPNGNMYIKFQHCYDIPKPDGFDFNKMQTISFIYKPGITYEEYEKQKKDHLDSLLKWCKELPYKK